MNITEQLRLALDGEYGLRESLSKYMVDHEPRDVSHIDVAHRLVMFAGGRVENVKDLNLELIPLEPSPWVLSTVPLGVRALGRDLRDDLREQRLREIDVYEAQRLLKLEAAEAQRAAYLAMKPVERLSENPDVCRGTP